MSVQDAFGYVIFGVVIVGGLAAVVTAVMASGAYEEIGKGGFFKDGDMGMVRPPMSSAADLAERDDEIRQMLTARNARRAAAGRPTVDVEEELARLTAPVIDDALRAEIRDHVQARNRRRERRGLAPLDVESEIERQIAALG
jgi:hypothetical protein